MYLPKIDEPFGSYFFNKVNPAAEKFDLKQYRYSQAYRLMRTHWKILDRGEQKCDKSQAESTTTECISRYLEGTIGCSMGMALGNSEMKRYSQDNYNEIFV